MRSHRPASLFIVTLLAWQLMATFCHAGKPFPLYHVIVDNVIFWEKVYRNYSLDQAVIHDSEDLRKIYAVVDLGKREGREEERRRKEKQLRRKYSMMLKALAQRKPKNAAEKRVAALFTGANQKAAMLAAAANVRSQSGQRERFREGVIRSGKYLPEIRKIFKQRGLPADLVYLPHVESSFNTKAYSKFGAAGIWQFTRATGKEYLQINYVVDERLDPILASHAAASYLEKSYFRLGHWPMAVTSYNYGLSGMLRAKKEYQTYSAIFTHYSKGHFKFASKNFYSEFLAAVRVAKDLEKQLRLDPPQPAKQIYLPGYASVTTIADYFGIAKAVIKELNPALRPPVFKGEKYIPKNYPLRLPDTNDILAKLALMPDTIFAPSQKASRYHRVKKGETAGSIARLYGVSLKKLMATNNLDTLATIYIHQKLRIPVKESQKRPSLPRLEARTPKKITGGTKREARRPVILVDKKKNRPAQSHGDKLVSKNPNIYSVTGLRGSGATRNGKIVVQPGESLSLYSDWLRSDEKEIQRVSGIGSASEIFPGKHLKLPFSRVSPEVFIERRLDYLKGVEDDFFSAFKIVGQTTYRVKPGDTMWHLCHNKFDIPMWLLERYNSTIDLANLQVKQELIIPVVKQL